MDGWRWIDGTPLTSSDEWLIPHANHHNIFLASHVPGIERSTFKNGYDKGLKNARHPFSANISDDIALCAAILTPVVYFPGSWIAIPCDLQINVTLVCSKKNADTFENMDRETNVLNICNRYWMIQNQSCYFTYSLKKVALSMKKEICKNISETSYAAPDRRPAFRSKSRRKEKGIQGIVNYIFKRSSFRSSFVSVWESPDFGNIASYKMSNFHQVICVDSSKMIERYPCDDKQFCCNDGTYIWKQNRCNSVPDCPDGSDEEHCPITSCKSTFCYNSICVCYSVYKQFICATSNIILPITKLCDYINDCPDGVDESGCIYPVCSENETACNNGKCIDKALLCDFHNDCEEGEDEISCSVTTCKGFLCTSGLCIQMDRHNNFVPDCPNGEDEVEYTTFLKQGTPYKIRKALNISCPAGWIPCVLGHSRCFPLVYLCVYNIHDNYIAYCTNGAHLLHCTDLGPVVDCPMPAMYHCHGAYCIHLSMMCDGTLDCPNGDDEVGCPVQKCPAGFLRCHGIHDYCIHPHLICDGWIDCGGGDDEKVCGIPYCPPGCICEDISVTCYSYHLDDFVLKGLIQVPIISLHNSGIKDHKLKEILHNQSQLRLLNLSHNSICCIDIIDSRNILLTLADFSHNHITYIAEGSFDGFPNLKYLFLQHNDLKEIKRQQLPIGPILHALNLSFNIFSNMGYSLFDNFDTIFVLSMVGKHAMKWDDTEVHNVNIYVSNVESSEVHLQCLSNKPTIPHHLLHTTCHSLFSHSFYFVLFIIMGMALCPLATLYLILFSRAALQKWKGVPFQSSAVVMKINNSASCICIGIYSLCIGFKGLYLQENFIFVYDVWLQSTQCMILTELSVVGVDIYPLTNALLLYFRQYDLQSFHPISHNYCTSIISIIWFLNIIFFSILQSYFPISNRYCFGLLPQIHNSPNILIFLSINLIYNVFYLITIIYMLVINIQLIIKHKRQVRRQYITNNEKLYIQQFLYRMVHGILGTTVAIIFLFMHMLSYQCSSRTSEILILCVYLFPALLHVGIKNIAVAIYLLAKRM